MAHLIQVGAGSGGMAVLDLVARDRRIDRVTLIEPDVFKPHNVERHLFPASAVDRPKAEAAQDWLRERRPELDVDTLLVNLLDPTAREVLEKAVGQADLGVCAADNEPAKFHWDELMRRRGIPWTLGEVLSGGIGGFVHWFVPGGPCYGCVAGHLQRLVRTEKERAPDYSDPEGMRETTVPADASSIHFVASLHALVTRALLDDPRGYDPGFTSLLFSLRRVPDIFEEAFRPYRFRIPRSAGCLICRPGPDPGGGTAPAEDLDVALDQALARLGNA